MLKRFLILLACISLLFVSPLYADELDKKVDTSSSKETIAIMESQFGESKMRSLGVPGYDHVNRATGWWLVSGGSSSSTLQPGSTAVGVNLYIDLSDNNITQTNIVRFSLPSSYGTFNYSNIDVIRGTFEDIECNGYQVTVYNPHWDGNNSNVYDIVITIPFTSPYTNNSDDSLTMNIYGSINSYSSGTELVDVLINNFTVSKVIDVLVASVTVCIGFVFMWWGLRKTSGAIMSAFRRGKLRI